MANPLLDVLIRDLMTAEVTVIDQGAKLDMALDLMREQNIRRLPVTGRLGKVVGILTIDEARTAMPPGVSHFDAGAEAERLIPEVRSVMNAQLHTVTPDQTAARAAQLMLQFKVGALPVVDGDELVGIITESDIFRFLTRDLPPLQSDWD